MMRVSLMSSGTHAWNASMSSTFGGSAVLVAGLLAAEAAVGSPFEEATLRADAFLLSTLDELEWSCLGRLPWLVSKLSVPRAPQHLLPESTQS